MVEIRDCMLNLNSSAEGLEQEMCVKTENCAELDMEDIVHLHSDAEDSDL
jgi:hypothetical protein